MAEPKLPSGTVTLLFTDIEGSTRLIEELGEEGYVQALTEHRRLVRSAFAAMAGSRSTRRETPSCTSSPTPPRRLAQRRESQQALACGTRQGADGSAHR